MGRKKKSVEQVKKKPDPLFPCLICANCNKSGATGMECLESRAEFWSEVQGFTAADTISKGKLCEKFKVPKNKDIE